MSVIVYFTDLFSQKLLEESTRKQFFNLNNPCPDAFLRRNRGLLRDNRQKAKIDYNSCGFSFSDCSRCDSLMENTQPQ